MKKILAIIILIVVSKSMFAQSDGISYQAVIIDPNVREMPGANVEGSILANSTISVRFTILDFYNNQVYQEVQTTSTDQYGMINLLIGVIDPINFSQIEWDGSRKDLKVEIDFDNSGETYVGLSRQPLLFVPYSYHRNITATGDLSVDGQSSFFGPLRVNDGQPTVFTGDVSVMGVADISGLAVNGAMNVNSVLTVMDTTTSTSKDTAALIVEGGVGIEKDLNVGQTTSIAGHVGIGIAADENIKLRIKDSSPDHIVSIENNNTGEGDGLLIKLGKENAKNENWAATEGVVRGYFEEGTSQEDIDYLVKLLTFAKTGVQPDWMQPVNSALDYLHDKAINVPLATYKISSAIAESIEDILNDELSLPRTYSKNMPDPVPDIEITLIPKLSIDLPPINYGNYDFGLGDIPGFILVDDDYNTVLNYSNEYISFQDKNSFQLGAVKAQSLNDWASTKLNNMYAFDLAVSLVGLDLPEGILEAGGIIKELAYSYLNIGVEYSSGNGDYAEWLERIDPNEVITKGDIVAIKGGKITKNMDDAEQVMAVSHFPIVLGNIPPEGKEHFGNNIAFMGQVPVKIMGPVKTGDYIVAKSEIQGYGVAVDPKDMTIEDFKLTVGRSWATSLAKGPKMINTVVGLHNGDYFNILKKYEKQFVESEKRFNDINERLQLLENKLNEIEN